MSATFQKGETTVTLCNPIPGYASREVKRQLLGRSAGGTVYTYDKGVDTYEVELVFESLTNQEKADLQSFFDVTVDGVCQTFTYTDSAGNDYTARFLSAHLDFVKVANDVWDVALRLELNAMGA